MLFNSFEFALFLPIVFVLYWFVLNRKLGLQNAFIVLVSYIFYAAWDWRYLFLIALTTGLSFSLGLLIQKYKGERIAKFFSRLNIFINIGILCIFKYYNFFGESFVELINLFGFEIDWITVKILLPVGISFYTFQALSYTIDIYRGRIEATKDVMAFFAYVSFFPQLVAGPIERATNLLPQFFLKRDFDYSKAIDGTRQILWGFVKKVIIADNCAPLVNEIFNNYGAHSGSTLVLGIILFAFQIYGDFSGYSDMAIGISRLFGFSLMQNFNYPYFSRDISEFWRRWHISLSTWFRDYIYIPLGGSRGGKLLSIRNSMIIFLVSGLWHGADWTFVIWGLYHGALFIPLILFQKAKTKHTIVAYDKRLPSVKEILQIGVTFTLVLIGWVLFRADNLSEAIGYFSGIMDKSLLSMPMIKEKKFLLLIGIFILIEWIGRRNEFAIQKLPKSRILRWSIYIIIIALIFLSGNFGGNEFIYFQF